MLRHAWPVVLIAFGCSSPAPRKAASGEVAPNKLSAEEALRKIASDDDPYWLNAEREVYAASETLLEQDAEELRQGIKLTKVLRGAPSSRMVALTFDDGPHPETTPALLDALRAVNVHATFFLVGKQAEMYPDLVLRIAAEGHQVANHTYHHVSLPKIPIEYAADEIKACGTVLKRILGLAPHDFRPPGGHYTPDVVRVAQAMGYRTILWSDDPGDYESPGADVITDRTVERATTGGIILLHDGIMQTVKAIPDIVAGIKAKGLGIGTVDDLMQKSPGLTSPGSAAPRSEPEGDARLRSSLSGPSKKTG